MNEADEDADITRLRGTVSQSECDLNGDEERVNIATDREKVEIRCAGHPLFDTARIRNIHVLKLDHLGNRVTAIRRLKRHFPQAAIHVMSGVWAMPIWALVAEIDATIELEFFRADPALPHLRFSRDELTALRQALAP